MYLFWFIPLLLAVAIGIWMFYGRVTSAGDGGVRKEGRTLVDKDDQPPRSV